ncbi:MAG TPA: hypothetical protein VM934_01180 [Pyrinomonadaceae bacterium]|jgi:hypothetical protein|nr:hypothetical protein [Pyrinomonadaceae bacterium]
MASYPPITGDESRSGRAAALDLETAYEPDDERAVRALLLIAGLPSEEIERVVAEMNLDSDSEM